eukprot:TRINITY_DN4540_c0_g1_i13.p2 TRINITY_DN4540_c0_g1~~TRINITY_DN4540_c0_g1_i13.p2  ORF type:complete len:108 (-),score=10.44 TRINITY_DN4540_c0_g1_i13:105-428(-)
MANPPAIMIIKYNSYSWFRRNFTEEGLRRFIWKHIHENPIYDIPPAGSCIKTLKVAALRTLYAMGNALDYRVFEGMRLLYRLFALGMLICVPICLAFYRDYSTSKRK